MGLSEAPVVARVIRGGFVESVHRGIGVVTAPDGSVERAVGVVTTPIFPRSSLKPLQALAALRAGAPLAGESLALACASHAGEPRHLQGVEAMLGASGLTVANLRNTPDLPGGEDARAAWLRAGRGKEALAQNCSGKHAGMLAACVAAGWEKVSYLNEDHPLQVLIGQVIEELTGERIVATAVDGCGAPVHALPIVGLARAFGRLAAARAGLEKQVADAMRAHPGLVGGLNRPDSDFMAAVPGAIAKVGAEEVFAVGLPDGRGVAVKIVDGHRAGRVLAAALLRRLGVDEAAVDALGDVPVLGHGQTVGRVISDP